MFTLPKDAVIYAMPSMGVEITSIPNPSSDKKDPEEVMSFNLNMMNLFILQI